MDDALHAPCRLPHIGNTVKLLDYSVTNNNIMMGNGVAGPGGGLRTPLAWLFLLYSIPFRSQFRQSSKGARVLD